MAFQSFILSWGRGMEEWVEEWVVERQSTSMILDTGKALECIKPVLPCFLLPAIFGISDKYIM
jgi:hypothetical protein